MQRRRPGASPSSARVKRSRAWWPTGWFGITRMNADTRPVRPAEQLDWRRLEAWLRERLPACHVPGLLFDHPMRVEQFPGGHSNLTYHVSFGDTELVLRRPPL